MRALSWIHRRFGHNNEPSRNVSTGKSTSCFSILWELDEQQHYTQTNNSAHLRHPRAFSESPTALQAFGLEKVNAEETAELTPEFFHGFLAIGTLGYASITEKAITPKDAMPFEIVTEKETSAAANELQGLNKNFDKLTEKEVHDARNISSNGLNMEKSNYTTVKDYSETAATKEELKKHRTKPDNLFKKKVTSCKKLDFMNKMLKMLDFSSQCIPTSSTKATICDSIEKKSTKVFRKSKKIHPEATEMDDTKSNRYEVKKMFIDERYDHDMPSDNEDNTSPQAQILKKDTLSSQIAGKKARWIKTDADYFVLEF
uniref:protein LAZY 1-like n=1 Tax=Erigeron canadensis TaxID=72917 RepID=UPI001CB8EF51|nr:protein LAZY 1-like [Erigeron canadensis]